MSNFKEEDEVKIANFIARLQKLEEESLVYYIGERAVGKKEFERYIRSKLDTPLARTLHRQPH